MKASRFQYGYIISGILLTHLLHLSRFLLVGRTQISGLPDFELSIVTSFWLSAFVLLPVAILSILSFGRRPKTGWLFVSAALSELTSQVLGRSLIKFAIDALIWSTVGVHRLLLKYYGESIIIEHSGRALAALHSELVSLVRVVVTVSLFAVGTLGLTSGGQLAKGYFSGELGQGTAWAFLIGVFYVAVGLYFFLVMPAFRAMHRAREQMRLER